MRLVKPTLLLGLLLSVLMSVGVAQATSLGPTQAIDVTGQGLTIADAGVGLEGLGTGSQNMSIDIGGAVQQAVLYWAGRDRPCTGDSIGGCEIPLSPSPYKDQVLMFDGNLITGDIVGTESQLIAWQGQDILNIGYAADVTSIVQAKATTAGTHVFTIEDGDTANNLSTLNGAGLLVLYTDPADAGFYRVQVFAGLDFAFGRSDQVAAAQVTEPVVFDVSPLAHDRTAEVIAFVGDADGDRPDRVDITSGGVTSTITDELVGSDGLSWDTLKKTVNVPSNSSSVTVQMFSVPFGDNPDSMLWTTGAMRIPLDVGNPAIDIEKFTLVQAASVDGDACDTVGKPIILTMMYTGDGNPTSHTQDPSKAVITGSIFNTDPVHIIATDKRDPSSSKAKVWFDGPVALGGTFDIDATSFGRSRLSSNTYVYVFNGGTLLQSIKFHTSCSQPLNLGDQFGSVLLVGYLGRNGTAQSPTPAGLGSDADVAPGPQAIVGDTIIWSYVVTNTGDVDLTGVTVIDDQGVAVTCPLTALAVGQSMTCTGTGTAIAGQYANIGTTTGTAPDSTVVTDQDPSHYHADVPQGDQCDTSGKPVILTMTYTGDQNPTSHTQDAGKVVITGLTGNATPVHIIATNKSDPNSRKAKIWFDGTVALGETFNIDAKALGRDRLSSKTFVLVYDGTTLLQSINFHTSCSQPLSIGDQFGSAQLTVYAGQADLGLTKKHKKGHH
ncbi:MAG: hypothetical protein IIC23_10480 [Chloroflexi bacterium]|nr:hypothetical protein [Chloroflexota bacterium]